RADGERWPAWRAVMFGLGLLVTVVATMGWAGRYAHVLLAAFATQALVLLLLAPALLATGAPLALAARALPPPWGGRISRVFAGLLELLLDAIPGFVLRSETHLLGTGMWPGLMRPWGASPLRDQQLAGDVLWIVAEVLDIPFLAVMLYRWTKADEKEQRRID